MVKGDSNTRETNGDPNNTKSNAKDKEKSQNNTCSKSGKKTNSTVTAAGSKSTLTSPSNEQNSAKLERTLEALANNMAKLTADVNQIKSQQANAHSSRDYSEEFYDPEQDPGEWSGYSYGGSHADEYASYTCDPMGHDPEADYYDVDQPLVSDVNNSESATKTGTENSTQDAEYNFFEEYSNETEKTSDPVNENIANGVNRMFAKGMKMDKYKDKIEKIERPSNATGLTSVDVEDIIWNLLKPNTKSFDKRLQFIQTSMAKSACSFTQMLDLLNKQNMEADSGKVKRELTQLGTTGLALLGHAFHCLCLRRRELQKPDVAWKYADLFSADVEHNKWLYGGKQKVEEMIKDIGTTNKVAGAMHSRSGPQHYYPRGASYAGPMMQGRRRGGSFRSRARSHGPYPRGGMSRGSFNARGGRGAARMKTAPATSTQVSRGEVSNKLIDNIPQSSSGSEPFQAGRLKDFVENWKEITSDEEILQTVVGCTIEFDEAPPVQYSRPRSKFNATESMIIHQEIEKLLEKQVLVIVPNETDDYLSTIFLKSKKNGTYRLILNLKNFNKNVEYLHFKMETFDIATKMLTQGCFMASIDLKDAYYSVPIHENHRKYLRFNFCDTIFQFTCLPNGLSCGPRKYTKLMKPVYATLRKMGINISGYLDDLLIVEHTEEELKSSVAIVVNTLEKLGFVINYDKSVLLPTKKLQHLGLIIDTDNMIVSLPEDKILNIQTICNKLAMKKIESIRNVAKVIGSIVACFPATTVGQLHYRNLEFEKDSALKVHKGNFDAMMDVTNSMKQDLLWWVHNAPSQSKPIIQRNPDITLTSDASNLGWGGTCESDRFGGRWNEIEMVQHINYLELLGAFLVMQACENRITGSHVLIRLDNTTAIAYINNMGGKIKHLNKLAKEIWDWCLCRNVWVSASHISGKQNTEADYESRHFNDRCEWSLNDTIFHKLTEIYGYPDIDLFASRLNAKCKRYAAWQRDPQAEFIDAFSKSWDDTYSYLFPPFSLIGRCLQKIRTEKANSRALMIVPCWPTQPWFTLFLEMLCMQPVLLPQMSTLLTLPFNSKLHPLRQKLKLIAGCISGNVTESQDFRSRLPQSSSVPGKWAHTNNTPSMYGNGTRFACKGKLISLGHL